MLPAAIRAYSQNLHILSPEGESHGETCTRGCRHSPTPGLKPSHGLPCLSLPLQPTVPSSSGQRERVGPSPRHQVLLITTAYLNGDGEQTPRHPTSRLRAADQLARAPREPQRQTPREQLRHPRSGLPALLGYRRFLSLLDDGGGASVPRICSESGTSGKPAACGDAPPAAAGRFGQGFCVCAKRVRRPALGGARWTLFGESRGEAVWWPAPLRLSIARAG